MMLLRSNLKKSTFYPVFKNSLFVILKMLHIFDYDQYHTKINIRVSISDLSIHLSIPLFAEENLSFVK